MKKIEETNLDGKNILIRCDYNVPLVGGELDDERDDRIEFSVDTIKYALREKAKSILLVSHLGRPGGRVKEELSLKKIKKRLDIYLAYLGEVVALVKKPEEIKKAQNEGHKIILLENIRFWPEEESGDEDFAKKITEGFDVYVNNAFPVSHRNHASLTKFPKFCSEKCVGKLFTKEIENLDKVKNDPQKPAVAIIAGAKIKTKLPVIESLAKDYDFVLVGGKTANEALDQKLKFPENVILPVDFSPEEEKEKRLDIGPETQRIFSEKISQARTIIWNGPLGMFEEKKASLGTEKVVSAIVQNRQAFKMAGGGETISALNHFSNAKHFDYVSMSGGAMLGFLANKKLPGFEALK